MAAPALLNMNERLRRVFEMDVRSLALVRIVLGVIILQDIARRLLDISHFYGDQGVLPTSYLDTFWTGDWAWSLHALFGGPPMLLGVLFAAHALFGIFFLLGFHTRIATVALWILTISLHNANPLILQGEDVLLRSVLFVGMFLPLGTVFSVDAYRRVVAGKTVLSGWTVAFLLQLGFLYFFVSLYKHSAEWVQGDAIYYAMSIDQYATSLGRWLLQFPDFLWLLTITILIFQSFALFLLFSPFYTNVIRGVTVALLMLMHAGFAATMHLGMFSAVSIAALCGFIPSALWDSIGRVAKTHFVAVAVWRWCGSAASRLASLRDTATKRVSTNPSASSTPTEIISIIGIVYIVYIFFWHAGNVVSPGQYVPFSHGFEWPAKVLRLDQRWNLFAPYPYRHDGWIVIAASTQNGENIDLFRDGAPLSFEKPSVVYDIYPRPRWRRYFLSLWPDGGAIYRRPYAEYLCRTGNAERAEGQKIARLEVIYMLEWTPAPEEPQAAVRPVSLIAWDCEKGTSVPSSLRPNE